MKKSQVEVICDCCKQPFLKRIAEYNRSVKRNSRHFCSVSCSVTETNKDKITDPNGERVKRFASNRKDTFSSFRWFLERVKYRHKHDGKAHNLDLLFLKQLWDKQKGICPITGWEMTLPHSTLGWKNCPRHNRASLDRTNSKLGYVKDNVRFIVEIANFAMNRCNETELVDFCLAVTKHHTDCVPHKEVINAK